MICDLLLTFRGNLFFPSSKDKQFKKKFSLDGLKNYKSTLHNIPEER
jgi:hypothetical protein